MTPDTDLRAKLKQLLTDYQRGAVPDMATRLSELLAPPAPVPSIQSMGPAEVRSDGVIGVRIQLTKLDREGYGQILCVVQPPDGYQYQSVSQIDIATALARGWNRLATPARACEHKALAHLESAIPTAWCCECGAIHIGWSEWRLPRTSASSESEER